MESPIQSNEWGAVDRSKDKPMRGGFRSLLFFLVGVLVGVLSLTLFLMVSAPKARYSMEERPKAATAPVQAEPAVSLPRTETTLSPIAVPDLSSTLAQRLKSARASAAAGRLQEAREYYLQAMAITPGGDTQRMLGELATVLLRIAGGDAVALRHQAARYEEAIARGLTTGEHYTPLTMARMAKASRVAADQTRLERAANRPARQASLPPSSRSATQVDRRDPPQRPIQRERRETIRKRVISPRPKTALTAKATPLTPPLPKPREIQLDEGRSWYVVQIGPIPEASESSEIAGELRLAGFMAKVSRVEAQRFRVVSGPMDRAVAERRVQALTRLGFTPRIESKRGGRVVIDFGIFVRAKGAESLAKRVRALGYPVQAVRESVPRHLVTVGPHRRSAADSIVKIVQSRFDVRVALATPP
jgi:cell division protein FtsN